MNLHYFFFFYMNKSSVKNQKFLFEVWKSINFYSNFYRILLATYCVHSSEKPNILKSVSNFLFSKHFFIKEEVPLNSKEKWNDEFVNKHGKFVFETFEYFYFSGFNWIFGEITIEYIYFLYWICVPKNHMFLFVLKKPWNRNSDTIQKLNEFWVVSMYLYCIVRDGCFGYFLESS